MSETFIRVFPFLSRISSDGSTISMGSSIVLPSTVKKPSNPKQASKEIFMQAARNMKEETPLLVKAKGTLVKSAWAVSLPIHQIYSRYLLASTVKKLTK